MACTKGIGRNNIAEFLGKKIKVMFFNDTINLINYLSKSLRSGCTVSICFNVNMDLGFCIDKITITRYDRPISNIKTHIFTGSFEIDGVDRYTIKLYVEPSNDYIEITRPETSS
jgi:hypothetical protein